MAGRRQNVLWQIKGTPVRPSAHGDSEGLLDVILNLRSFFDYRGPFRYRMKNRHCV
jgi:hypothetical protein